MPAGHPNPPKRYTDVQDGDLWQVGRHLFVCGDGEDGRHLAALIADRHIDMVYVDPPWNNNDNTFWRNRARGRDVLTPSGDKPRATALAARLVRPARDRRLMAYMEVGIPNFENFETMLLNEGARITGWWNTPTTVNKKLTCRVVAVDFREHTDGRNPNLEGMEDGLVPETVLAFHGPDGGKVVLDPCCGLGFTSRAAEKTGWSSLNHELNPDRLARTMEAMEDLSGHTARLLGPIAQHTTYAAV